LLTENRREEIKRQVQAINRISLDYHLTHAVFACSQYLREIYKKEHEEELRGLNSKLKETFRSKDEKKSKALLEKINRIEQGAKVYIYVEYVTMPVDASRVINVEGRLVIFLSESLRENIRSEDGSFIGAELVKLRQVIARELGLILLHLNDLQGGTQGTKLLDGEAHEEAGLFAKKLLELRHERNVKQFKAGRTKQQR
jgi:hypothetical protein